MPHPIIKLLKSGKVVVMPTDTIYGIVGSALNPQTVEKIYDLRKRAKDKPFIVLVSHLNDTNHFNVKLTDKQKEFLQKHWPNPLSVILPVTGDKFKYLHKGTNSLAFRMPKNGQLIRILKQTGPLIAPSANLEGEKPAENIDEARNYFGSKVDYYLDGGQITSLSSTLVKFEKNSIKVLRQGSFVVNACYAVSFP